MRYTDRVQAGRVLAEALAHLKGQKDVVVLGVPRGGVVVAAQVARALGAPLDVAITRKVGAPGNPEFAIGAVSEGDALVLDRATIQQLGVPEDYIQQEVARQRVELARRLALYRRGREPVPVQGKTVVLVDDGVATGATMLATVQTLRARGPARIIVAVPVASADALDRLAQEADEVVCPYVPAFFWAVGAFYEQFDQTPDEEVVRLLEEHRPAQEEGGAGGP
ncbi:MAG: phosphoribosyltransferase [Anaerolineae bacterium]|nr:phosphoribosyltransferase [Anaerolineae bacterium]